MTKLSDVLAALTAKIGADLNPRLVRIWAAQQCLNRLGLETASVMVAGTNGKGSTAGMLWHLLSLCGLKTGLLTSPHLVSYRERFRMSDAAISDDDVADALGQMRAALPGEIYDSLSFYEATTLLGLYLFRARGSQINVVEVGVGGQNDSTNINSPEVSLITSIGSDHRESLGATDDLIAAQKAGVIRFGRPVLWGGERAGSPLAAGMIKDIAAALQAPLYEYGRHFAILNDKVLRLKLAADQPPTEFLLPAFVQASPEFLQRNFAMAVAALALLLQKRVAQPLAVLDHAVAGFAAPGTPRPPTLWGRFQSLRLPEDGQPVLLDVCHNVDGARTFRAAAERYLAQRPELPRRLPGLVTILRDKDVDGILSELRHVLEPLVLFKIEHERGLTAVDLADVEAAKGLLLFESFAQARAFAQSMWKGSGRSGSTPVPWVVCGSVKAVGEVLRHVALDLDEHF